MNIDRFLRFPVERKVQLWYAVYGYYSEESVNAQLKKVQEGFKLKVEIELISNADEQSAHIKTTKMTEAVRQAKVLLQGDSAGIPVSRDGEASVCELDRIYYIESVDNKCFVYTKSKCFETRRRLYEIEKMLDDRFFRCSKSMICNVRKIVSVKTEYNARMSATLLNGEKIIINRSYKKELKKRLGM